MGAEGWVLLLLFFASLVAPPVIGFFAFRVTRRVCNGRWTALPISVAVVLSLLLNPLLQEVASVFVWDEQGTHFHALAVAYGKPRTWIENEFGEPQKVARTEVGETWSYFTRPWYFYPTHRPTEISFEGDQVGAVDLGRPQAYPFN